LDIIVGCDGWRGDGQNRVLKEQYGTGLAMIHLKKSRRESMKRYKNVPKPAFPGGGNGVVVFPRLEGGFGSRELRNFVEQTKTPPTR